MKTRRVPQASVSHLGLLTLGVATSIYPVSLKVKMLRRGRLDVLNRCYAPLYPASSHGGYTMKLLATFGVLLFVSVPAHAQAQAQAQAAAPAQTAKPCEELKDEITKKLDAKGVKGYTLERGWQNRRHLRRRHEKDHLQQDPRSRGNPGKRTTQVLIRWLFGGAWATLPRPLLTYPTARHSERSRPIFSSAFAPLKGSACAERNLSALSFSRGKPAIPLSYLLTELALHVTVGCDYSLHSPPTLP